MVPGKISGVKFEDLDGDGVWDKPGELPLSGWNITLTNTTYTAWMLTNATGQYEFTGLWPSAYWVNETLQDGWTQTRGNYSVTITSGQVVTDKDFGNFKWLKVSGYKKDTENNGLSGWSMKLYNSSMLYASNTTEADGYYEFLVKDPETYSIKEVLKDKWTEISPVLTYSPGDGSTPEVLGYSGITVQSGVDITMKNFTNFEWITVSGHKYEDTDGSKPTSSPLDGWTIKLYKWDGSTWVKQGEAVTGYDVWPDGYYEFNVTEPGDYQIREVLLDKWTETYPVLTYSPGDGSTPSVLGYEFTAESGVDVMDKDFWNFEWLTVSGTKTEYGGSGLSGWTIELYKDGVLYDSAITAGDGSYSITVKDPGTYDVKEVLKDKWTEITPVLTYSPGDGSTPSVLGYSGITVSSGVDVTDKDFVNFEWLTVSGVKYEDTDGTKPTSKPLEGWTIELYKDGGLTPYASTDTLSDGSYSLTIKDPGSYLLKEVLKDKWTETYPVLTYSPGDGSEPSVLGYDLGTVTSGVDISGKDFWNFEWFTVSGYKFFDADGDGDRDAGEPGLQYWAIKLERDSTTYGGPIPTAPNGYYEFTVKDPGHYTVSETLLGTCLPWTAKTPMTVPFDAVSGTDVPVDFGNWLGKSIVTTSSYCWFDVEAGGERQFKLIFTPDVPTNPSLWRLTASNPGQFYYNVFYVGGLTAGQNFTITLPYPFVTQGANPVHVYSSLNTNPDGCLIPGTDITSQFTITPPAITLTGDYNPSIGDYTATINVESKSAYSGFVYITVHLDYGLKKTIGGLNKDASNNAILPGPDKTWGTLDDIIAIQNHGSYQFSVSGPVSDTQTVQNLNVFKRDPGFGGLVTDSVGNPVKGVKVQIYGPDGKLLATVYTDEDGWYQYNYKYTGKAATFTIKLPDYGQSKSVTLKANSFVVVNFQI